MQGPGGSYVRPKEVADEDVCVSGKEGWGRELKGIWSHAACCSGSHRAEMLHARRAPVRVRVLGAGGAGCRDVRPNRSVLVEFRDFFLSLSVFIERRFVRSDVASGPRVCDVFTNR